MTDQIEFDEETGEILCDINKIQIDSLQMERYPRSAFLLADKIPLVLIRKESELEEYFSMQLERCGARYFDCYLIHDMGGTDHAVQPFLGAV